MNDMGHASRTLGIDIIRNRSRHLILLSQRDYQERLLKKYGMIYAKAVMTPLAAHYKLSST